MENIIETKNVRQGFPVAGGELFWALKGINITVPRGKLTMLKGRSGSGKTTLMNILGALDYPLEGEVLFQGQDITKLSEQQRGTLRRTEIGFVFQSVALIPMLNAFENVDFSLRLAKYKGGHKERVEECLRMVGLGSRMNHMPQEMSGGEQQRVAIARALAKRPKLLLCDEPTGALDYITGKAILKLLQDTCRQQGMTVVVITHNTAIAPMADKVIHVKNGRVDRIVYNESPMPVEEIEW